MRKITLILAVVFTVLTSASGLAQQHKQVYAFTPSEMDNVQMWFLDETDSLQLSDEKEQDYINTVSSEMNRVFRLTYEDSEYSKEEIKERAKRIFEETSKEVKPMLTEKQYKRHRKTTQRMLKAYLKRLDHPSDETGLCRFLNRQAEKQKMK